SCLTEFLLTLGADVELLPETRADGVVELVGVANVELLAGRQPNVAFLARAVGPQLESGGVFFYPAPERARLEVCVQTGASQFARQHGFFGDRAIGGKFELLAAVPRVGIGVGRRGV